ncbi:ribosomal protein L13e [Blastocladiella britannica]|nr:ribosomal protein L13e [Blastocladiella britannica]
MVKHNNQLPNQHFRKNWQIRVKTWFNQPGQKVARRVARATKAAAVAPRPVDAFLRPAVRCPTVKHNRRLRSGRGFSFDELKAAGINRKEATTIGIAVDHRRKVRSEESLALNVQRLKTYKAKLVVFPTKGAKPEDVAAAVQHKGTLLPVVSVAPVLEGSRKITAEEKEFAAYQVLRKARTLARYHGIRAKRALAKAAAEADAKK